MDKRKSLDNACSKCGKPVYFAERKTSLGRDWHPSCLKCEACGKVLSPGQHAERRGKPYCHIPCYKALFGPQMVGYGSNVASPANFRKSSEVSPLGNGLHNSSIDEEPDTDGMKLIFKTTNTDTSISGLLRQNSDDGSQQSDRLRQPGSDVGLNRTRNVADSDTMLSDAGLKCIYQSGNENRRGSETSSPVKQKTPTVSRSHSDVGSNSMKSGNYTQSPKGEVNHSPTRRSGQPIRGAELFRRVQSYNEANANKRGQALQLTEESGNVRVQGPLRIYWGLKKPIILKQYDEVPAIPLQQKRFSVYTDGSDLQPLKEAPAPQEESGSPTVQRRSHHGLDDSVILSPTSDVVMRRTNIRKSNTVAYRGDRPNKWKRASINGHIYNYDTSVFTPVLGSCTSVTVDNKMSTTEVIKTLLDKFKVENKSEEYNLYIVSEHEDERLLRESDIPLLERLALGPTDSVKLFIRDKPQASSPSSPSHIPGRSTPVSDDTQLPEEVEQLLNIPEPVLRGLLVKFQNDEEDDIRRLKAKYERIRKRVRQIIEDKKRSVSRR